MFCLRSATAALHNVTSSTSANASASPRADSAWCRRAPSDRERWNSFPVTVSRAPATTPTSASSAAALADPAARQQTMAGSRCERSVSSRHPTSRRRSSATPPKAAVAVQTRTAIDNVPTTNATHGPADMTASKDPATEDGRSDPRHRRGDIGIKKGGDRVGKRPHPADPRPRRGTRRAALPLPTSGEHPLPDQ